MLTQGLALELRSLGRLAPMTAARPLVLALALAGCSSPLLPQEGDTQPAPVYPNGPYGASEGEVVANIELLDLEGHPQKLASLYRGEAKVVVLYLAATWCFTCGPEIAWLNEKTKQPDTRVTARVVVVENQHLAPAQVDDGQEFRDHYQPTFPTLVDPSGATMPYRPAGAIPLNLVIRTDRMQIVLSTASFDPAALDQAITNALEN
jgi:peroxiredoxin